MNDINNSKKLYTKAKKYIAGGISSQIRVLEHSEVPLFIKNAKGSKKSKEESLFNENSFIGSLTL